MTYNRPDDFPSKLIFFSKDNMKIIWIIFAFIFCSANASAHDFKYREFSVNIDSESLNNKEALRAIQSQIDMLYTVGFSKEILSFFQTATIEMSVKTEKNHFSSQGNKVVLNANNLSPQKPILMHEFLHFYFGSKIKNNPDSLQNIEYFYRQGLSVKDYKKSSHFLKNNNEFFASSGTAILFKKIYQEPFSRDKVKQNQPQYFKWFLQQIRIKEEDLV